MIKLVCFLRRKPGMSIEAFQDHWLESHGPLIAGIPELARHIVRYEQNHRLPEDRARDPEGDPGFDGATIQWLASKQAFFDFVREPLYAERIAPDEASFLDRRSLVVFFTHEQEVVLEGARARAGVKLLTLLRRHPDIAAEEFHAHWRGPHARLFKDTQEVARHILAYHQSHAVEGDAAPMPAAWDGLAEQWYASPEAFHAMLEEPRYREQVPADEARFMDRGATRYFLSRPPDRIIG